MSASGRGSTDLTLTDVREWAQALGIEAASAAEDEAAVAEHLRDGVLLCHLVNKIRPGSVELVSSFPRQPRVEINQSFQLACNPSLIFAHADKAATIEWRCRGEYSAVLAGLHNTRHQKGMQIHTVCPIGSCPLCMEVCGF